MRKLLFILCSFFIPALCLGMDNVLYVLHDGHKQALTSISKHLKTNYIVIAQAYRVRHNGEVAGEVDADVISFSKANKIRLMPLVTNSLFDSDTVHQFLLNPEAQKNSLNTLLAECKKNNFYGVQFDFEMVRLADRDLLTNYYKAAAQLLHDNKFIVSFAVAPTVTDSDFPSAYLKKLYTVWQGAYDLKALAPLADFITIMTYDQHAEGTIPGPSASIEWDKAVLKHVLKSIPANKLSLGVPTYSGFWYMGQSGKRIYMKYDAISFDVVVDILKRFHKPTQWDAVDQVRYMYYSANWTNRFMFVEDQRSFKAKVALAKKYHLQGISIFRLGMEDPKIWQVMSK